MDNETAAWIIWLALLLGSVILEAISLQLFSIWFAAGALVALITSLLGGQVWLQVTLFVVVTIAALIATRPLAKKLLRGKIQPTNADRCVGKTATVIEEIDNNKATGQIKIEGAVWTARSLAENEIFAVDALVEVKEIQGVKAMVVAAQP